MIWNISKNIGLEIKFQDLNLLNIVDNFWYTKSRSNFLGRIALIKKLIWK